MGYEEMLELFQDVAFIFWKYDMTSHAYQVLTNPNALSSLRIPREGDLATLSEVIGEDQLATILRLVKESLSEQSHSFKTTFSLEIDQKKKTFAIFGRPEKIEENRIRSISGIVLDIGFIMDVSSLEEEKRALEQAIHEKNRFLSELSHELRTPLNGISGMSQLLKLTTLDEEQREYLRIMQAANRKMSRLIDNLIRYTLFLGKKTSETVVERIKMTDLLRQTVESQKLELVDRHLSIEIEVSPELESEIELDAESLSEVLDQLLDNAIKFSSEGQIVMRAFLELDQQGDETLKVEVEDEGTGFDVAYGEQMAKGLSTLNAFKKMSGGLGLGLQIVHHVCEMSDIHYIIESYPNKGTKVSLTIPFERERNKIIPVDFLGKQMVGKRALVVDDDENGRVLLSLLCKKSGLIVQSASSGYEAIKLAGENRYDLIYLDIQMPQMNGVEVLSHIRETLVNRDVPVIAVTAYALKGDEERFLSNGFDGYIGKPVEFNRFEQTTRHVLQLRY